RAFHPLAGMIVSGGSPALGSWGSLGGVGHISVTARVNGIKASLPNPDSTSATEVPSSFHGYLPAPVVEAAVGLVRGRNGFRAVASWKFALFDVAAGLGVDHYTSSQTNIRFHDGPTSVRTVVINPSSTRELLFVDGGVNLAAVKFVAELGFQTGKDQSFATTF